MRARKFPVHDRSHLAIQHFERNISVLCAELSSRLRVAPPVRSAAPYLIALDAIEIDRITDFKKSPYYAGVALHKAKAADPVVDGCWSDDLLAQVIHDSIVRTHTSDVVCPHSWATKGDPFLARVTLEYAFRGDRVFFVCRHDDDHSVWLTRFDDTLHAVSDAGAYEIGFCTLAPPAENAVWTPSQLDAMIDTASCVFASALDGEGYLVWDL